MCVCVVTQESQQPSEQQICYRMVLSSYTLDVGDDVCTANCIAQIAQNNNLNNVSPEGEGERKANRTKKIPSSITPRHILLIWAIEMWREQLALG